MDNNEFIAEDFQLLVAQAQENDLIEHEKRYREERERAEELRRAAGDTTMNASELLQRVQGDDEKERLAKLDAEIAKLDKEAADAVAARKKEMDNATQPDRFPAPPITTG